MRVYGTRIKSITYNLKPICMKIYMLIFTYKNVENCFNENRRVTLTLNEVVYTIYNKTDKGAWNGRYIISKAFATLNK